MTLKYWPIGAHYSSRKRLDFRCKRSVSVFMTMRAFGRIWDAAPLALPPLWGFGGDGA
jgi:hypothetical protein